MKKMKEMRFNIAYAPTAMSPPYFTNVVFISITTMHEQAFIEKGDIPIAMMFFTMSERSL